MLSFPSKLCYSYYSLCLIPFQSRFVNVPGTAPSQSVVSKASGVACSQIAGATLSTPAQMAVSSLPQMVIEPCTPVSAASLHRAMNPPPSIRSFFKPKPPVETGTCSPAPTWDDGGVGSPAEVASTLPSHSASESVTSPVIQKYCWDDDDACVITKASSPTAINVDKKKAKSVSTLQLAPAAKRSKQSSLLSAFGKASMARATPKDEKNYVAAAAGASGAACNVAVSCPICQKLFTSPINNAVVNAHVDRCLDAKA